MPRTYSKEKVEKYLESKAEALRTRSEYIEDITTELPLLLFSIEQWESEINEAIRQMNDPGYKRERTTRRLIFSWENVGKNANPLKAPRGPSFFVAETKTSSPPSRIARPSNELLRRIYTEASFNAVCDHRDTIMQYKAYRDSVSAYIGDLFSLTKSFHVERLTAPKELKTLIRTAIPRNMPDHIHNALYERRHWLSCVVYLFESLLNKVVTLEDELDREMMAVNQLGGKNRNLVVSWVLPKNVSKTIYGLLGPYWYTLGQSRFSRNKNRVPANQSINRDFIRKCYQGRHDAEIIMHSKIINQLSNEREQVLKIFKRALHLNQQLKKKELPLCQI